MFCVYMYANMLLINKNMFMHGHASKASSANSGPKPTFLYSNYQFFQKLYLPLPDREWTSSMVRRQGKGTS